MDGWIDRRLPDFSSSTYCELNGLLDAVTLLTERRLNGVIICDSKSALLALFSSRPTYDHVVQDILCRLANASDNSLVVSFLRVPSHVGLAGNDTVDGLAKAACTLDLPAVRAPISYRCYKHILFSAIHALTVTRRDAERANSVSIQHYDSFIDVPHKYCRHGLMVRRHNVVSARLRLGYRPIW